LRDTTPEKIWAIDPLPEAHELMQSCNLSCNQVQSEVFPPITLSESESFDIIYAHSVFSHLEEGLASSWLRYLESLLAPGGVFIFTTRGRKHINFLKKTWAPEKVRGVYGDLATIQSLLNKGEFVFCRNRSENADFSGQWFGEAFIPKQYVENFFGKERVSYTEEVPLIPQAVFVIRKP
jgi:SAM-dependent methyltransferase